MSLMSTMDAAADRGPRTALKFKPLTKYIGCEISGIDLRQPVSSARSTSTG
jgi:hypothetical protein